MNNSASKADYFTAGTSFSAFEYLRAMSMLMHTSADLPESMIDYFYAKGLTIGSGDCVLLLFSAATSDDLAPEFCFQRYQQLCTIVSEELSGYYRNYPVELDGRLCCLIVTRNHTEQPALLLNDLKQHCEKILSAGLAASLQLSVFISSVDRGVRSIAKLYDRTKTNLQYYQFLRQPYGVINQINYTELQNSQMSQQDFYLQSAEALAELIYTEQDYIPPVQEILSRLLIFCPHDPSAVRENYNKLGEQIYRHFIQQHILLPQELSLPEFINRYLPLQVWSEAGEKLTAFLRFSSEVLKNRMNHADTGIAAAKSLIRSHFADQTLSIAYLAEQCGMKPSSLCTAFKREYGHTIFEYISELRMKQAITLMRNTDESLDAIAAAVGFGSIESLTRSFRKTYGTTPGRFRRMMPKTDE